ncbi:MAG: ATP-binding protein [Sedimentibacter sp.]
MIPRKLYLDKLIGFKDKQLIKIITGIRRCGKSTLFEIYQQYLMRNGVEKEQIISVNFEDVDYSELKDYKKLHNYIKDKLLADKMNYVFLDEIQLVPDFQIAVNSLYIRKNIDLYITGSNAYMLSGEIATLLSGRYIEIQMLPLSFKEFVTALNSIENLSRKYTRYVTESSFPQVLEFEGDQDKIREYLGGIYNTIILKDIIARKKIADYMMLDSLVRFMFNNIGNMTSTNNIANTMKSQGRAITVHTVERYLNALTDSYILYRVGRYDVKGKQYLKTGDKYYIADIGLRYYLLGKKNADFGYILENIIYLELLRRGNKIYTGKVGNNEIDFITETKAGLTEYYQVALTVREEKTLKRELLPLESIKDHNTKYLLTLDEDPLVSHNGIKQINALDWLME